tara:strand:- start:876 stop:1145 length:270 start_codon:yes stop_codon:yes gene_type:complete
MTNTTERRRQRDAAIESSVRGLFADWTGGTLDKWAAYGAIWAHLDSRQITLRSIRRIASDSGISNDVINMRRRDYLKMGGGGVARNAAR